jgi:hypothetical protein
VLGQLGALVPGQRPTQLLRRIGEAVSTFYDRVSRTPSARAVADAAVVRKASQPRGGRDLRRSPLPSAAVATVAPRRARFLLRRPTRPGAGRDVRGPMTRLICRT